MTLAVIGGALGGIGLFLLGMRMMTDGLKVAAGEMLRDVLARWTRTPLRGLASGILITGIVQSSSAVTVATIGFVNAGILALGQAMWVIFGSNVGTTMTGWVVAVAGFDLRIEAYALPLLGAGMFLSLTGIQSRRGALGEAIAGFGVFFLGIATLKATFGEVGRSIDVADIAVGGVLNDALFVGLGFLLTALVQSSSAVVAIALTAAAGGLLTIEAGAALVIGANIGTTTTAALAVIGATSNAKRVAVAHIAFNALTGLVALALLPLLVVAVGELERTLRLAESPATALALFHTGFNALGVLLIWPLARPLERWLSGRFVTREEDEARPRFLDNTVLEVPALGVNSLLLELNRLAGLAVGIARSGFLETAPDLPRLARRRETIDALIAAIGAYARNLSRAKLSGEMAEAMSHPFRAMWHLTEIADRGAAVARRQRRLQTLPEEYRRALAGYADLIALELEVFLGAVARHEPYGRTVDAEEARYQLLKTGLLEAASTGELSTSRLSDALETLDDLHVSLRFAERASRRLQAVAAVAMPMAAGAGTPDDPPYSDAPAGA